MNLRCSYCQTMFSLSRETMLTALEQMDAEGLHHFDAHCPKCRRANSMSRDRLEKANPGWRGALKEMQKQAAKAEKAQGVVEEKSSEVEAIPSSIKINPSTQNTAVRKPAAAASVKTPPKVVKPSPRGKKPITGSKSK